MWITDTSLRHQKERQGIVRWKSILYGMEALRLLDVCCWCNILCGVSSGNHCEWSIYPNSLWFCGEILYYEWKQARCVVFLCCHVVKAYITRLLKQKCPKSG